VRINLESNCKLDYKTKDIYVGSSINLSRRFTNYFNISYLSKNNLIISRALIKYGFSNFSLEILEYCDKSVLLKREQHYMDILKPNLKSNTLVLFFKRHL
jgi:group I intron endonuclease